MNISCGDAPVKPHQKIQYSYTVWPASVDPSGPSYLPYSPPLLLGHLNLWMKPSDLRLLYTILVSYSTGVGSHYKHGIRTSNCSQFSPPMYSTKSSLVNLMKNTVIHIVKLLKINHLPPVQESSITFEAASLRFIIQSLLKPIWGCIVRVPKLIGLCDIVGGNMVKLRHMDAMVHIFYEVTSITIAFASSASISVVWFYVSMLNHSPYDAQEAYGLDEVDSPKRSKNYLIQVSWFWRVHMGQDYDGAWQQEIYIFLENTLAPAFAKCVLGIGA
ncbi:hypothetical protein IW262DRAFT_1302339 [Armillaria fumosa]|nr:hypothetical protein IW262DRAFT_1302339 [Armillaria fumosa]